MSQPLVPSDVQIQPNSTGALVELNFVTQSQTGISVGRQAVSIGDPSLGGGLQAVSITSEASVVDQTARDLLNAILTEMRVMNAVLAQSLGFTDDLDQLRADPYYASSVSP